MSVKAIDRGGYQLLEIDGFLDGHTTESAEVHQYLEEAGAGVRTHYVLDLSAVEYVNSSMLGQFLQFLHAAQERNCQLLLMNPPPSVANVLELTGLTAVLPVVQTEEEIKARLGQRPGKRIRSDDVDYDALAQEIENIVKGDRPVDEDKSQLGRILGD